MKPGSRGVVVAVLVSALLGAAGCRADGGEAGSVSRAGPTVTVASFTYNESVVLAEVYAQALEAAGFPVDRRLNLGSRELLYPEFTSNGIDLLPEYLGSALAVGFGGDPTADVTDTMAALRDEAAALHAQPLEPAPGEDRNEFVVTDSFAREHRLASVSDLAPLDHVRFSGAAECETRTTCLLGLRQTYGLTNLEFRVEQETAIRVASLRAGNVDLAVLYSTLPVFTQGGFVVLDDDLGVTPVENIVPLVSDEAVDAYGADFVDLVNQISRSITTEALIVMNARVEVDAQNPDDVAHEFLLEAGLLSKGDS